MAERVRQGYAQAWDTSEGTVYGLVESVTSRPQVFPPTIHVERLEYTQSSERIRIWATARGEVKSWTSRRELDPRGLRITFRQEVSASMGGAWVIEPLADDACRVRLLHDYRALDDTVHVDRVELRESEPGLQLLTMDTLTKDGSQHTTESVRVCFPASRIVCKQTRVPALMTVHTGRWSLAEESGGVAVTSRHTVVLNPGTVHQVLGKNAGIGDAREFVRGALSANSLATLGYAEEYAERKA
ncbi:aromatase/cyclase [Streptomyces acidiscabies]|uniref:aromatase/cyclase n=1 Tax=Streptomyces acidiscabies TaxID=42234 RepID=UPI00067C375C|nr:aromatase/cyclase [Streptomyces acidiscabies]